MVRPYFIFIVAVASLGGAAAIHFASRAAEPSKPPVPAALNELKAVEKALTQPAMLKFDKTPLQDVAAAVAKQYQINVRLDLKALQEANIRDDLPISFQVEGGTLRSGLRLMLRRHELGYITFKDNVLLITTAEKAKSVDVVRIYDVRDLVGYDKPSPFGGGVADFDSLIDAITSCIAPTTCQESGPGEITPVLGCLVFPQIEEVHDQTAALLQALRKVHQAGPAGCEPVRVDGPDTPLAAAVQAQLDRRQDIHFKGGALPELTAWLRQLGIPSIVEEDAATQVGEEKKFAGLELTQVPLGWALRRILSERELGYYVAADGLVITTREKAEWAIECVVYPLRELLGQNDQVSLSGLDKLACAAAGSNSHDPNANCGGISVLPDAGALIFVQTHEKQARFAKLLAQLQAGVKASKPAVADQTPVVRVYRLSVVAGKTIVEVSEADAQKYVAVIRNLIEPKSWTDGTGYIATAPGAIVVRQTPAVQEQVESLLDELGAPRGGGTGGGFGGGGGAFNVPSDSVQPLQKSK